MIQPAPGVMLEHEWPLFLPKDLLFPIGRIRLTSGEEKGYEALADAAPDCARDLASASCDVIAFACAIGSLFAGAKAETRLLESIAAASARPAISLAESSARALRRVGARNVAILTPYSPATNAWCSDYLQAAGFDVAGTTATPADIVTIGNYSPAEIAEIAIAGLASLPEADSLWIPCTAVQTMEALDQIEGRAGLPVISGSQALLWAALQTLGIDDAITGAGRLFG